MCSIFNSFVSATKWWLVEQHVRPAPCLTDSCPLCGLLHYSTPLICLTKCFSVSTDRRNMSSIITAQRMKDVHEGSLCMWSLPSVAIHCGYLWIAARSRHLCVDMLDNSYSYTNHKVHTRLLQLRTVVCELAHTIPYKMLHREMMREKINKWMDKSEGVDVCRQILSPTDVFSYNILKVDCETKFLSLSSKCMHMNSIN